MSTNPPRDAIRQGWRNRVNRTGAPRLGPAGGEAVLLVEDEPAVRALVAYTLRTAGYTVLEAGTGAEAGAAFARAPGPVRLLLTDVVMPGGSGGDLAARLTAVAPGLRVLFMSGYPEDAVVRRGVRASEVAFLQKPFDPDSLLDKVREVLDEPACSPRVVGAGVN